MKSLGGVSLAGCGILCVAEGEEQCKGINYMEESQHCELVNVPDLVEDSATKDWDFPAGVLVDDVNSQACAPHFCTGKIYFSNVKANKKLIGNDNCQGGLIFMGLS